VETVEDVRPRAAQRPALPPLRVVALLLALVCAGIGAVGLATADRGIERHSTVVAGVPLEVARPTGTTGRLPGVVVAHGLAASRQLMRGFADTLARRGYAVELAGHGASTARLPGAGDGPAADARFDRTWTSQSVICAPCRGWTPRGSVCSATRWVPPRGPGLSSRSPSAVIKPMTAAPTEDQVVDDWHRSAPDTPS
jgi:hypothetical protein